MRNRTAVAVALLIVLPLLGFLYLQFGVTDPADLDLSRERASGQGIYRVAIMPEADAIPQNALHAWIATITTPEGEPVADATIAVDGGMPDHGHGLPTQPQAGTHLGEGRYRIEGLRFNMGGWWVLRLEIASPAGEDVAEFNLSL